MNFTVEKSAILSALQKAAPITARRTTLPILSYLLMEVKKNQLTITATDLESGIRISVPVEVAAPGIVCAHGRTILQAVSNLADGPVSMTLGDNLRMKIESGNASMSLACLDADDFPAWAETDEDTKYITIMAGGLAKTLERVMFAASSDESRFGLNGIYFEQEAETLNIVATDGHRLAFDSLPLNFGEGFTALVPKKNLLEMKKLLDDHAGDVTIGFNSSNMILTTETLTATARLVSTQYPEYRKVIPQESDISFVVNRDTCVSSLKRVAFLLGERNKGLDFSVSTGSVEFSATHPDLGTATDKFDIQYDGEPVEAIINGYYLQEALAAFDCESVIFEKSGSGPIVFRPEPEGGACFNLVMPMRK